MPSRSKKNGAAGFTLIEMIVVLVILSLVIGILVARGPTRSATVDLTAASRSLTDALRHARGQAIATGAPVMVSVVQAREALAAILARRTLAGPITLALHSPADDPHEDGSVRFTPDGSANDAILVLRENQEHLVIAIDWLTGRISQGPILRGDSQRGDEH